MYAPEANVHIIHHSLAESFLHLDKNFENKITIFVNCLACELKGFLCGRQSMVSMSDHIVETWEHTSRQDLDAGWVGIGVTEYSEDVDFL